MDVKPSLEAAARRLRIDGDLLLDLQDALEQAHDEALAYLDRPLFADAAALTTAIAAAQAALDAATDDEVADQLAQDLARAKTGIVVTQDIIAAQLLLADRLVGDNDGAERERKEQAAYALMRQRRRHGA